MAASTVAVHKRQGRWVAALNSLDFGGCYLVIVLALAGTAAVVAPSVPSVSTSIVQNTTPAKITTASTFNSTRGTSTNFGDTTDTSAGNCTDNTNDCDSQIASGVYTTDNASSAGDGLTTRAIPLPSTMEPSTGTAVSEGLSVGIIIAVALCGMLSVVFLVALIFVISCMRRKATVVVSDNRGGTKRTPGSFRKHNSLSTRLSGSFLFSGARTAQPSAVDSCDVQYTERKHSLVLSTFRAYSAKCRSRNSIKKTADERDSVDAPDLDVPEIAITSSKSKILGNYRPRVSTLSVVNPCFEDPGCPEEGDAETSFSPAGSLGETTSLSAGLSGLLGMPISTAGGSHVVSLVATVSASDLQTDMELCHADSSDKDAVSLSAENQPGSVSGSQSADTACSTGIPSNVSMSKEVHEINNS